MGTSGQAGWRDLGACKGLDSELFFPTRGEATKPALAVCAHCAVRSECLEWALHHERLGVWAGTSERERRQLRRRLGIRLDTPSAPAIAGCGTANGYQAHIRAGETACEACRDARNVYQAQRKRLKASA